MEKMSNGLIRQNSGARIANTTEDGKINPGEAVMEEARIKIVENFKEKMQLRRR